MKRFWDKVDSSAGPSACWPWTGRRRPAGYGQIRVAGRTLGANRVALELTLGRPLAPGMKSLHSCDNPPCCNPAHLQEGTQAENIRQREERGRRNVTGARNPRAKLTVEDVREIRSLADRFSRRELAARFGVSGPSVSYIINGKTWTGIQ